MRTDTASLVVSATSEAVYRALVDPEALAAWLPPDGMTGRFEWFDLRPDGGYRLVLTYDDAGSASGKSTADTDIVAARFLEIVRGSHVVQAIDFDSDDPDFTGTMTMTWSVSSVSGGTLVEIRADDVPAGISAEDHATGMASSLAHLADYVAESTDAER